MDVAQFLHLRIALADDAAEAEASHADKGGLEGGERFDRGAGAAQFVVIQHHIAQHIAHRHDRAGEAAFVPSLARTALAFRGVGVDIGAGVAFEGGDEIGTDALRGVVIMQRDVGIGGPGAAVVAKDGAAHRFDAAADARFHHATADLRGDGVHRIEAGAAEAVDLKARNRLGIARIERRRAGQHAALLADRLGAAHHHLFEEGGVEIVAGLHRLQQLGDQLDRGDFVQRAIGPAASARGADMVIDENIAHR